jgi:hypothetical protein
MPDFSNLRRGAEAIAKAQADSKGGGNFSPFTPSLFWTDPDKNLDSSKKYIMFLNKLEDIPQVDLIAYIPQKRKKSNGDTFTTYEQVIARTDPVIGEAKDPMVDEWEADPKVNNIAVAVELVPVLEEVNGRKRVTGFEVATTEFERRVRDDNGDLLDDTEEVEAPIVGFVTQSPHNFFNLVTSFDADTGPIEATPIQVKRLDQKTYSLQGFVDTPVDLSGLIDCIDNLSYLGDDVDDLLDALDQVENDQEAAELIGAALLDKRLEELVDEERYDKLFESLTEPFKKFGSSGSKKGGRKERTRKERPQRRSSRRSAEAEPEAEVEAEETPAAEETTEEKPARRRRSRAKAEEPTEAPEAEAAPEAEPEEKPKRRSAPEAKSKLDELREKQKSRRTAA